MGAIDEAEKLLNINKNDFEIQFEENIFIIWKHKVKCEI
jgi:hypothetical protein